MADEATGSLFRSNKRRKIFRKRPGDSDEVQEHDGAQLSHGEEPDRAASTLRRPLLGAKRGIAFSNNANIRSNSQGLEEAAQDASNDVLQPGSERFVRPTGKAGVVEDKNMTVYIDAKLRDASLAKAGLIAPTVDPSNAADDTTNSNPSNPKSKTGQEHAASGNIEQVEVEAKRRLNNGQHSSSQQNPNTTASSSNHRRRRKRAGQPPDPSATERSSMVDQIMAESLVPLYDKRPARTASALIEAGSGAGETDEAVAEAFRRKFLADVEERSLRARPPPMPSASKSSGPKLGGSRQQRGKMIKEAKEGQTKAK